MESLCMDEGCFPPISPGRTHQCPLKGSLAVPSYCVGQGLMALGEKVTPQC